MIVVITFAVPLPLSTQDPSSPRASPAQSPRENGIDKSRLLKKDASSSPASTASSGSSTSMKSKEMGLVSILYMHILSANHSNTLE